MIDNLLTPDWFGCVVTARFKPDVVTGFVVVDVNAPHEDFKSLAAMEIGSHGEG